MPLLTHTRTKSSTIVSLVLLISLITACDIVFFIGTEQYALAFYGALVGYSLLLLPLIVFRNKLMLYATLLIPILILAPINLSSILLFDVPINDATILLFLNTNSQEAIELLKGYLPVLAGFFLFYGMVTYVIFRQVPRTLTLHASGVISLVSLFILLLLPVLDGSSGPYLSRISARLYTIFPTSLFFAGKSVYRQYNLINANKEERKKFTFGVTRDSAASGKQIALLIIGESARYDHWGINGYSKNTSPRLSKRDNFISFSNAAAGGFITEFAVPLLLTGVRADEFDQHYRQKGITGAFDEADFKTYWITNQLDEGHIKLHIEEADTTIMLQSDYRATKNIHRDMELLGALKKILAEPGDKKFIVMHTLGSHYDYSARYPDEFDWLKPSNKTVFSKSADKKFKDVLINSYDNSILYTDAVIDSAISLVADQYALSSVTYISDHGENLFDDDRDLSQHGYPVPSKYIAHIPFFLWYSPELEKVFPQKISFLKEYKTAPVSSAAIIHTLTSLNGISFPTQDSTRNMTGPYFKKSAQKILGANKKVYKAAELN
jgi:glucan phosphoethanolaminetransferase (alkaline phosphatase superfamily)